MLFLSLFWIRFIPMILLAAILYLSWKAQREYKKWKKRKKTTSSYERNMNEKVKSIEKNEWWIKISRKNMKENQRKQWIKDIN